MIFACRNGCASALGDTTSSVCEMGHTCLWADLLKSVMRIFSVVLRLTAVKIFTITRRFIGSHALPHIYCLKIKQRKNEYIKLNFFNNELTLINVENAI